MNYKNNLSLLLASTMVSGAFLAAVNAAGYKFATSTGNLQIYTVTPNANNKNIAAAATDNAINLNLKAGETATQRFMFAVKDEFINSLAENNANAAWANAKATLEQKEKDLKAAETARDAWRDSRPDGGNLTAMKNALKAATTALNNANQDPGPPINRAIGDVNGALSYADALKQAVEIMARS